MATAWGTFDRFLAYVADTAGAGAGGTTTGAGAASREAAREGVARVYFAGHVTNEQLTAFFDVADQKTLSRFQRATMMKSGVVVRGALRALFAGKAVYVPGFVNRANAFLVRFVSRPFSVRLAGKMMK